MRKMEFYAAVFALAVGMGFTSCTEDEDAASLDGKEIASAELKSFLMKKGLTFNEEGKLVIDDAAKAITSLDLTGTNMPVDALSELSILPNLKEVDLSDNGYGPAFDFAKLPEQITGIDLTGNEIYDYDNLVECRSGRKRR